MIWETTPKAGRRDDVNLRVTEEPEDVLEHHRITATSSVEEGGAENGRSVSNMVTRQPEQAWSQSAGMR